jgi:hypothetical protein
MRGRGRGDGDGLSVFEQGVVSPTAHGNDFILTVLSCFCVSETTNPSDATARIWRQSGIRKALPTKAIQGFGVAYC